MGATVLRRTRLLLALAATACLAPTDPTAGDVGQLRLRPSYAAGEEPEALRLRVDSASVVADPAPDPDAPAVDAVVALPDAGGSMDWLVDVTGDAVVYHVRLRLTGEDGTLYQGEAEVSVPRGAVDPGEVHDVPVRYVGPARAMAVEVTPRTSTLDAIGASVALSARAFDRNGAPLDDKTFAWTSSAPAVATVDAAGLVTAVAEGEAVISAMVDDLDGAATVTVAVTAASGRSTIEADPASRVADGTSTATITVRLLDANGNPVGQSGGTVELAATVGSLGPVTDHGDGRYTASLTSVVSGSSIVTGRLNGEPIADDAQVIFMAGPAAPGSATIGAAPAALPADGVSAADITVQLFDANGNPLTQSGGAVALATTLGTLGAVTDHGDGTYGAALTSTVAGTAIITGTLDGAAISDDAAVTFEPGPAEPASATITAVPVEVEANGDDASIITVRLFDANGNPLAESGGTVALATTLGTLTSVTDHNNGTYTAELRSGDVGTAVVTGTLNGAPIADDAQVLFVAGPAEPGSATITAAPVEVEANGDDASIITVRLFDANGNPLGESGGTVALATTLGTLTSVTDRNDGTYTAELRSTAGGTATVTGTLNGAPIANDAQVLFTVVDRNVVTIEVTPPAATLAAIGATQQYAAVARDAGGAVIPDVAFGWSTGDEAVATIDPVSGLAQATGNGSVTIAATAGGVGGTATLTVRQRVAQLELSRACPGFGPGGSASSGAQAVVPVCDTLRALGDQLQIVAEAVDANGHPVADPALVWTTGAPDVATVDLAGLVTAVGNGTAIITAAAADATATIDVVVKQAVDSVRVVPSDLTLAVGAQEQLRAEAFDANGHLVPGVVFTWGSLNQAVAGVDQTGLVTGKNAGSTKVRAKTAGVEGWAHVEVR